MKRFIVIISFLILISLSANSQATANAPDGIRIVYDVRGEGATPTLIFVHGWSCDRSYWKAQAEPLSQKYKVVTIDLPGHGESGFGRKEWTMEAFGADVAAVVDKLGLQRVILIGHSMGGEIIVEAARRLRGRVAGLVMVDAYKKIAARLSPEVAESFVSHLRVNFRDSTSAFVRGMFLPNSDPKLVEWVATDMSSAPPEVGLSAVYYALIYGSKLSAALKELKLPVIAINPDNSPTDLASMKEHGVEVLIIPGLAHFLMMEDPKNFNSTLITAIAKLR